MTPQAIVNDVFGRGFAPPPKMSVSEWADQFRVLSSESGASAGQWRTLPFQRAVFDSFSDPETHTVVIMSGTQLLKTEFILNCIGYLADRDPGPAMLILPRDSDVDLFSKVRLAPMIRDSDCLREKMALRRNLTETAF